MVDCWRYNFIKTKFVSNFYQNQNFPNKIDYQNFLTENHVIDFYVSKLDLLLV
jgi:hypothetical protein